MKTKTEIEAETAPKTEDVALECRDLLGPAAMKGDTIEDSEYGVGEIISVSEKTVMVKWESGHRERIPKEFVIINSSDSEQDWGCRGI